MKYRYVTSLKVLDLAVPLTASGLAVYQAAVAIVFARGTEAEASAPVSAGLAVLFALIAIGMWRRERVAFLAYTAVGVAIGAEMLGGKGPAMPGFSAFRMVQGGENLTWPIAFGSIYTLFRLLTGGSGVAGSAAWAIRGSSPDVLQKIAALYGGQDLTHSELRTWMIAAPFGYASLILVLLSLGLRYTVIPPFRNMIVVVFIGCAATLATIAIRRSVREITNGDRLKGQVGIGSSLVSVILAILVVVCCYHISNGPFAVYERLAARAVGSHAGAEGKILTGSHSLVRGQ